MLVKIRGKCLIAKEARYHGSCKNKYTQKCSRNKKSKDWKLKRQYNAHEMAFNRLHVFIDKSIIGYGNIAKMKKLYEKYQSWMRVVFPVAYNENNIKCTS